MQNRNLNPDFQTPPSLAASEEHWQRMGGEARREPTTSGDVMGVDCPKSYRLKSPVLGKPPVPEKPGQSVSHFLYGCGRTLESPVLERVLLPRSLWYPWGRASGIVPTLQMGRLCLEVGSSAPNVTPQEGGRVGVQIQGS